MRSDLVTVIGPSCGGKSRWAEYLVKDEPHVTYVATSTLNSEDLLWHEKITRHKNRRPSDWSTIETSSDLASVIKSVNNIETLLIDSLGGFVSQLLELDQKDWEVCEMELFSSIKGRPGLIVLVIEETGWSVVPSTKSGLIFRERLGTLAMKLEKIAKNTWLVVQGRALSLTKHGLLVP